MKHFRETAKEMKLDKDEKFMSLVLSPSAYTCTQERPHTELDTSTQRQHCPQITEENFGQCPHGS